VQFIFSFAPAISQLDCVVEDAMSKMPLLCGVALIASGAIATPTEAQESTIPNFTSANFGWLVNTGFDYQPVEGSVALVGADPNWRGGIGLPANDFNYQPPEAAADPRRQGPSRIGPWNIERLSDAENPNLKPSVAAQMRMHNKLVSNGRRAFSAMSCCWPGGPAQLLFNAEPIYFVQMPQEVWNNENYQSILGLSEYPMPEATKPDF
jgi:hypothetical protein